MGAPETNLHRQTKTTVRAILDKVKGEGRTSLTAPEGKLVCDAYAIPVPKEGVATSAADAAKLASGMELLQLSLRDTCHALQAAAELA